MFKAYRAPIFLALLAGALVAACQPAADALPPPARSVSLAHYFSFAGAFSRTIDDLATAFNQTGSPHTLKATPLDHESFKISIRNDLDSGNTADVYSYWAGARTETIRDRLAPIDDLLPPAELARIFPRTILSSASRYGDHLYLLPVTQHYVGFFYNRAIFARLKLAPPRTWSEFLTLIDRLRAAGVTPIALGARARWPAQFWFDYLLLRSAPLDYRQRLMDGTAAYTDPEVRQVFAQWAELIRRQAFNDRPNELDFDHGAAALVHNGQAAMTLMGTWLIGYFNSPEVNWQEDRDYGFFPFPEMDPAIPRVALGPIDGLIIPRASKNLDGAKAVLRHFAQRDAQLAMSRGTGALAPHVDIDNAGYSPIQKQVRAEIGQSSAWAFNYDLATPPDMAEIGLTLFATFLEFPDQYPLLLQRAESQRQALKKAAP